MKNRIGQSKPTNAPPGIRTGVWLIMLGLLMLCLFVVSLSYRNAIHSAGVSASGSKDAIREDSSSRPRAAVRRVAYNFAPDGADYDNEAAELSLVERMTQDRQTWTFGVDER